MPVLIAEPRSGRHLSLEFMVVSFESKTTRCPFE